MLYITMYKVAFAKANKKKNNAFGITARIDYWLE